MDEMEGIPTPDELREMTGMPVRPMRDDGDPNPIVIFKGDRIETEAFRTIGHPGPYPRRGVLLFCDVKFDIYPTEIVIQLVLPEDTIEAWIEVLQDALQALKDAE